MWAVLDASTSCKPRPFGQIARHRVLVGAQHAVPTLTSKTPAAGHYERSLPSVKIRSQPQEITPSPQRNIPISICEVKPACAMVGPQSGGRPRTIPWNVCREPLGFARRADLLAIDCSSNGWHKLSGQARFSRGSGLYPSPNEGINPIRSLRYFQ